MLAPSVSLAYRLLATQLMVSEASYFSDCLQLATSPPIQAADILELYVGSPNLDLPKGKEFLGNLKTAKHSFSFTYGRLSRVSLRSSAGDLKDHLRRLADEPLQLNTNDVYRIATQLLARLPFDPDLSSRYPCKIEQLRVDSSILPRGSLHRNPSGRKSALPVFHLKWGDGQFRRPGSQHASAALEMTLSGATGELSDLIVIDESIIRRPLLVVPHAQEINRLPDAPFNDLPLGADFSFSNVLKLMEVPERYRDDRIRALRDEALAFSVITSCDNVESLRRSDFLDSYVWPPQFGLGGMLRTSSGNYRFDKGGKIAFFQSAAAPSEISAGGPSLIGTNKAYRAAIAWSHSLGGDLEPVTGSSPCEVFQDSVPRSDGKGRKYLPYYEIRWGSWAAPALKIVVGGYATNLLLYQRSVDFPVRDPTSWSPEAVIPVEPKSY